MSKRIEHDVAALNLQVSVLGIKLEVAELRQQIAAAIPPGASPKELEILLEIVRSCNHNDRTKVIADDCARIMKNEVVAVELPF